MDDCPGDPVEAAEVTSILDAELARLPADYRSAVIHCDLEGWPHEKAAQHLDCPLGTVKSRLARGRAMLREAGSSRRDLRVVSMRRVVRRLDERRGSHATSQFDRQGRDGTRGWWHRRGRGVLGQGDCAREGSNPFHAPISF